MAIHLDGRPADTAVRGIIIMNVFVAIGALVSGDGMLMLMWPYWIQSVVIGYYAMRRIQKLERFATDNFKINGAAVDPTPQTRRKVWTFFLLHYGFFHLVYFMFLGAFSAAGVMGEVMATADAPSPWAPFWYGATLVGFLVSHGESHREHVAADLRGRPNIGTLMFVPYIRIVPMHLTIIFGAMLGGTVGLLLFASLKTAADVAMHKVEHRMLQGARA
ncbi:DUF6498-containing protein [Pseudogemmatithrix spongiicola]|uniref:DUF6498-containing protein n=1 Tax=Pseudogemmatithrix spongiicola TaxID=3062599 RepID=A0AA49JYD5_9BACT|nr:DUF6498-containing protein [Gemmatimonadaceae bacterium 'strain 138']WKW14332.1 DUF6498-containing protein [Gemmatimonadaceae bacterium 'strain 318']